MINRRRINGLFLNSITLVDSHLEIILLYLLFSHLAQLPEVLLHCRLSEVYHINAFLTKLLLLNSPGFKNLKRIEAVTVSTPLDPHIFLLCLSLFKKMRNLLCFIDYFSPWCFPFFHLIFPLSLCPQLVLNLGL